MTLREIEVIEPAEFRLMLEAKFGGDPLGHLLPITI